MADERCRFLATDFDGAAWVEEISAFRDARIERGVPIAIERSRSSVALLSLS